MEFLLGTLPEETALNYREKLRVSIRFWRERGGCLSEETIARLRDEEHIVYCRRYVGIPYGQTACQDGIS